MSKKSNEPSQLPGYPRAPPLNAYDDNVLMQRPAPPSYEESLRQQSYQQMQPQHPAPMYASHNPIPVYGYPQVYGMPTMNNQPYNAVPMATQAYSQQPPVLELAKGAEIRTTSSGAISIPPPPPGCAPTPAQWAAMQGKSVLVKEPKKRSFFS